MKLFAILSLLAVSATSAAELSREERAKAYLASGSKVPGNANNGGVSGRELFSVTTGSNTCFESCGGQSADGSCWCDEFCHLPAYDDCCNTAAIFCPQLATCAGVCGGAPLVPGCSCDPSCQLLANCCHDFDDHCDYPSCGGQCGGSVTSDAGSKCWCDSYCELPQFNDCCFDKFMSTCSRKLGEAEDFEAAMKAREEEGSTKKAVDGGARRAARKSVDGRARRAVRGHEGGAK